MRQGIAELRESLRELLRKCSELEKQCIDCELSSVRLKLTERYGYSGSWMDKRRTFLDEE